MGKLRQLWKSNKLLLIAFVFAALITVVFIVRTVVFTVYWADPSHRDQAVAPWMTTWYVANSWDLPRGVVADALGLEIGAARGVVLGDLAAARGVTLAQLTAQIQAAAAAFRAAQQ